MTEDADVLLEQRGRLGLITLNKPKALNALSLSMVEAMQPRLLEWAASEAVDAVLIRGAGEKAFCAGGDIRDLYESRGTDFGARYYAAEYTQNVTIHTYPKPYLAWMDGVTMGGGVGVAIHGSHRIVTERTLFAMPETGIGLFPDIGASWFLSVCPGAIGMYLGLTGYRMRAADCLYAGIADIYIESQHEDTVLDALAAADRLDAARVNAVLKDLAGDAGEPPLAEHRAAIDRCFSADSVAAIVDALEAEGTDWARAQIDALAQKSPTALMITHRQLRTGPGLGSIADVMQMEFRMADRCFRGHDLFEGIRAVVIDKDGAPNWRPGSLADVSEADVEEYFAPVPGEPDFTRALLS